MDNNRFMIFMLCLVILLLVAFGVNHYFDSGAAKSVAAEVSEEAADIMNLFRKELE
jgi:uncharacterized protein (UPF0333 family)